MSPAENVVTGRAEKDCICRDRAGVERFVAFGTDIPLGWTYVRDAEPSTLPPHQLQPRAIANADAVAVHQDAMLARAGVAATGEENVRGTLPGHASTGALDTGAGAPHGIAPLPVALDDRTTVKELEAEVERLRASGIDVQVTGTGSNGNVVREDLVAALEPHRSAG